MSHRKRKHRQRSDSYNNQYDQPASPSSTRPDPSLFIVAHEADIIRGPQAARTADSLEVSINVDGNGGSRIGDGLIKWESGVGADAEEGSMWVDRYDARLLLDPQLVSKFLNPSSSPDAVAVHIHTAFHHPVRPDSPDGWSDLPSDAEDTFFLTPDETADLHRTKRLRHLDALRTARLRALSPDTFSDRADADPWGGSDEEPEEQQMELMRRTASHVVRATNDAQLRARILAHHGADPRFAFLRGRWGRAWALAQAEAHRDVLAEQEAQSSGALGGLTGYGSGSDGDGDDDVVDEGGGGDGVAEPAPVLEEEAPNVSSPQEAAQSEEQELALRAAQEARRAKAREWAEKRRAAKALALVTTDLEEDDQSTDIIPD